MRIELDVSREHEDTAEPWWIIINPQQNLRKGDSGVYAIANMITGPFFSRQEAQEHLQARRYAFSKDAKVFCHSGCWTKQYKEAYRKAEKEAQGK